jgi:two-component system, LytTR family, sensor kinase
MTVMPKNHLWYHLAFWILIFGLWSGLFYADFGQSNILFMFTGAIVLTQIGTSYATTILLIPRFLYQKSYFRFGAYYLVMLLVASAALSHLLVYIASLGPGASPAYEDFKDIELAFVVSTILLVFCNVMLAFAKIAYDRLQTESASKVLAQEKLRLEKEKFELETEKLANELRFLKAQINPHFLFNTLNSIFNLITKDPEQARELLVRFSDMLRYHLYETTTDKIPLETELAYIRSYAHMEKVRKGKNLDVVVEVDEGIGYLEVVPLVLLTFVENAFKHVSNYTDRANRVSIRIQAQDEMLVSTIRNTKDPFPGRSGTEGGIGLANVKRRLELMYPGQFVLQIDEPPDTYVVTLKLSFR